MKKMCSEILIKVHLGLVACMFLTLRLVVGTSKPVDYEIRTLTGEPDYKSVNLTWEIENSPLQNNGRNSVVPKVFTIFYCELQSFGPHRCRSKVIEENSIEEDDDIIRHYSTTIENLRMATKYSFHIKPQAKRKQQKVSGRSDSRDNEVHTESMFSGQTIVIPTKGFSAQATKCLPHISEIEVQTGPYFGGKIVVDGGNCGIQGNPKDPVDKYVMRIDHAKCGSLVKPETNTVETFITVQENLGIFTHSTRRFVVVCTFQSGIQTVRASFTVPGKGGVAPIPDDQIETERSGRERQFRMVDKSALVLKEPTENTKPKDERDVENSVGTLEDIPQKPNNDNDILPTDNPSDNLITDYNLEKASGHAKFAMLVDGTYAINGSFEPRINPDVNYTGLVIAVSLSLIMIGVFIYILQREIRRLNSFDGLPKRQIMRNQ